MYFEYSKYILLILIIFPCILGQSPLQFKTRKSVFHSNKNQGRIVKTEKIDTNIGERIRLPTPVTPSHYALEIMPVLDEGVTSIPQFTAPGKIMITIDCHETTGSITLHSSPIVNITEASVQVLLTVKFPYI